MWTNSNHQVILEEEDVIDAWLGNKEITAAIFDDIQPINIYNDWCKYYDAPKTIRALQEDETDNFVEKCLARWNMPDSYRNLNIVEYLLNKTTNDQEYQRVLYELSLYEERGMIIVLQFLKYLSDVCQENNIVLGVGRGSSVSSYCLYLLGIHRINSIKYDLDIKEFLK